MSQKTPGMFSEKVRTISLSSLLIGAMGCASGYWENLPQSRAGVLAYMPQGDTENVRRAVLIVRKLAAARPLPVDIIYVFSSDFGNALAKAQKFSGYNAGTSRCGTGNPPPHGCMLVGNDLLTRMSDDALAGVLAHELGHLERGHKSVNISRQTAAGIAQAGQQLCSQEQVSDKAAAIAALIGCGLQIAGMGGVAAIASYSRDMERDADSSGVERLAVAGYCSGPVMKKAFAELSRLVGPRDGGLFDTHPSFRERWQNAGTDCGPLALVGEIASPQRNDDFQKCYEATKTEATNPDSAVQYCSRAIQSAQLSQESLAAAFHIRGNAYLVKQDYDRAIRDYDQVIHLSSSVHKFGNVFI